MRKALAYLRLGKPGISLLIALSAAAGYILCRPVLAWEIIYITAGTLILSLAAGALNQLQEQDIDARMNRTRNRPLPSGRLTTMEGIFFVGVILPSGLAILFFAEGIEPMCLGIAAIVLYNMVYTPLKRKTAYAAVPGALIGAIPPAIGWTAAGGILTDPAFTAVALFFILWQLPHFWLLMLSDESDYRAAGLPSLVDRLNSSQIVRLTFIWILGTALTGLMLPIFFPLRHVLASTAILAAVIWMVTAGIKLLRRPSEPQRFKHAFMNMTIFAFLVMLIMSAGRLAILNSFNMNSM